MNTTLLNILMLFFTGQLLEMITVNQIGIITIQLTHPSPMMWNDIVVEELMHYLSLVIAMGILRSLEIND